MDGVEFNPRDRAYAGGEAVLYRGTHENQDVLLRDLCPMFDCPRVSREELDSRARREVIIQWQADHKNLLRVKGVHMDGDTPLIVLPHHEGGKVMDVLKKKGNPQLLLSILQGAISGVKHLHHQQPSMIHGDLHPENLVLDKDGNVVIIDFGLARIRHEQSRTHTTPRYGGIARYLAPELHTNPRPSPDRPPPNRPTECSDVYALAMTFFALAFLEQPFSGLRFDPDPTSPPCRGRRPEKPSKARLLNNAQIDSLWSLLEKMWSHRPEDRPDIADVEIELNTVVAPYFQRETFALDCVVHPDK